MMKVEHCQVCKSAGVVFDAKCPSCDGTGHIIAKRDFRILSEKWGRLYECIDSFPRLPGVFIFGFGKGMMDIKFIGVSKDMRDEADDAISRGLDYGADKAKWMICPSIEMAESLARDLIDMHDPPNNNGKREHVNKILSEINQNE
ncbi:MAG: hypothetical protein ACTSRU_15495 [Candidatus Hodarchaeales archaeon]